MEIGLAKTLDVTATFLALRKPIRQLFSEFRNTF